MLESVHYRVRASQRGLRDAVFAFICDYGTELARAGARFLTIVRRDLPPGLDRAAIERALGWIIVLADDGTLLTCYRRADAPRYIRRKTKRDRCPAARRYALAH